MFDSIVIGTLWTGVQVTLKVVLYAAVLGTTMSIISGLAGLSRFSAVRAVNRVYVDFFRGTSAIVQLYWFYFALPLVGISVTALVAAFVTLGLNMGSYGSEVVRGSILAVPKGQYEASTALDLSGYQRMRYVVFPQAVRIMLPPYGNLLIELLKGTALVSLITLPDATFEVMKLRSVPDAPATSRELFSGLLVIYFAIALVLTAGVRSLERFFGRGQETRLASTRALRLPRAFGAFARFRS